MAEQSKVLLKLVAKEERNANGKCEFKCKDTCKLSQHQPSSVKFTPIYLCLSWIGEQVNTFVSPLLAGVEKLATRILGQCQLKSIDDDFHPSLRVTLRTFTQQSREDTFTLELTRERTKTNPNESQFHNCTFTWPVQLLPRPSGRVINKSSQLNKVNANTHTQ